MKMIKSTTICFFLLIGAVLSAPHRPVKRSPDPKPHSSEDFHSWEEHRPHYGHHGHYEHYGPHGHHEHYHHGHHDDFHHYGHHGHNPGIGFGIGFHV